jgi:hypothetical protein
LLRLGHREALLFLGFGGDSAIELFSAPLSFGGSVLNLIRRDLKGWLLV